MKLSNMCLHFFQYFKKQPKELYAWEEIETSHGITLGKDYIPNLDVNTFPLENIIKVLAYGDGMTVKKMQHHEY